MFQNPFNVLGRALRHTSLGVLCWLEVIDLDPFLGFLYLAPHVCHFSFAGLFISCVSVRRARINNVRSKNNKQLSQSLRAKGCRFCLTYSFLRIFFWRGVLLYRVGRGWGLGSNLGVRVALGVAVAVAVAVALAVGVGRRFA